MSVVPLVFLSGIRNSLTVMRDAGLSETQIACIVQDIRSYTLNDEFRRIKQLMGDNPPHHHSWCDMMDAINVGKS